MNSFRDPLDVCIKTRSSIDLLLWFVVLFGLIVPVVYGDSESVVPNMVPVSVWHLFYGGEELVSLMDGGFGVVLVTMDVSNESCVIRVIDWNGVILSRALSGINVSRSLVWRTRYEDYMIFVLVIIVMIVTAITAYTPKPVLVIIDEAGVEHYYLIHKSNREKNNPFNNSIQDKTWRHLLGL